MSFVAKLQRARAVLEQQERVSTRALQRELEVGSEELEEIIEELVDVQRIARREDRILVWAGSRPDPPTPGPPTPGPGPSTETRKVISILFADLMGSTALQERLDPESVNRVMDAYYAAVRGPVEAAGGTVVQLLGDGVLCAFGIPRIAEDDALRAVRAAVGIQQAFREFLHAQQLLAVPIGLRVAVNTGEVVVSDEHPAGIGDPLNVAARLQQEARDGEVLIGQATRRLVADAVTLERAGVFALKGRAETVTAYRVVSLERPTGTTAAFVGRDEELARLTAVYEAARDTPAARLAVLLGSPGLGKSRLIDEVSRRLGDRAGIVAAHCDAAGGATFAPVAEALRQWLGASAIEAVIPTGDTERTRIAAGITALLGGSPPSTEETFFVIRRLLTALAKEKPLVLVIDDLQWAEPLLLDLVEHLIQWGSGVPLLVLVGARPELREVRSSLVTPGGLVSEVVTLSGLDAGAAMRLAANVIGAADLPAAVAAKVLATSEGNPLFVGELVRMLVDEGAIERQGERWIVGANLAALQMPPTIHALLAARIERLGAEERTVLERASVVGRHFSRSAVAALLGRNGAALDARLEALRRTELIEPDTGWLLGEPVLRFHHVLIRDAAYRRLLKGTRAELHERLANWMEAQVQEAPEHDETIGRHLEQAHQLRSEIGPLDASGKGLGERAARRLSAAGRRALARDDVPVAADLLGRAIDRLDPDDPTRADLALDWCEALLSAGDVTAAAQAIAELGRFAGAASIDPADLSDPSAPSVRQISRLRAWHTCFTGQLTALTAPQELQATADAVSAAAEEFATLGDAAGEAKAHSVHAQALARLGRVGDCEAALDKALAAARRAGDRRRANTVLALAPLAALWGPSPVTRASGRCLDVVRVLRITQGAPAVEAVALSCQGVLEALRGRTDAAHRMIASGRKMVEELGIASRLFEADVFAGFVTMLEGDAPAAERTLRGAYDGLRDLGLGIDAARAAALLARALLAQDRIDEAEALSHESEALAGDDLKAAIAWRGVRAEALAKRGQHTEAIELARAAVAIAAATDALLDHADARLALAVALEAAGREREAGDEARRAQQLWEEKGATLLLARRRESSGTDVRRAGLAPAEGRASDRAAAATGEDADSRTQAVRRAVRPNAATVVVARIESAAAARDFAALRALFRDDYRELDHPTGSSWGLDEAVASVERLFRSRDPYFRYDAIATLGPSLYLGRRRAGASGAAGRRFDVGAYENPALQFFEADDRGRMWRSEAFAADRLGDAIACLYERYAESLREGPERSRAATIARSVAVWTGSTDPEVLATAIAPSAPLVDHRTLATWSSRDAAELLQHFRIQLELAPDFACRIEDALALEPNAFLVRNTYAGTDRSSGGSFENRVCVLFVCGPDGLVTHIEIFEAESEAEALARFEELAGTAPPPSQTPSPVEASFANAASRADSEFVRRFNTRDWAGIEALAAPELVFDERRRMLHNTCGRGVWLEQLRVMFDVPRSRFTTKLLATRGERLALSLHGFTGEVAGGGGPLAMDDHFALHEVDGEGRIVAIVLFDLEAEAAAHAELDARWEAGEALAHPRASRWLADYLRFFAARDWDAMTTLLAPDLIAENHRLVGWGTRHGPEGVVSTLRAQIELAPDTRERIDHVRTCERGVLLEYAWYGTHEGGAFENLWIVLIELDEDDRARRIDVWEAAQHGAARARLAELVTPVAPTDRFANTAVRALDRWIGLWMEKDWERFAQFAQSFPAGFHNSDRRRAVQLELDRDETIAFSRTLGELATTRITNELLATRGDRLALVRARIDAAGGDVGPSEIPYLGLCEVDAGGGLIALVRWDEDDVDAAYAELDARYEAGEAARPSNNWLSVAGFVRAVKRRDWDAVRALCSEDFVEQDHRGLAVLGRTEGAGAWVENFRTLVELAPDTVYRAHHVLEADRGYFVHGSWYGTREGGPYELQVNAVLELDDAGRIRRADIYDDAVTAAALARLAELATGETGDSPT